MIIINTVLKWTACAATLVGAACTALNVYPLNIALLNLGSVLYLMWAVRIREWNLIVVNAVLLLIYIIGAAKAWNVIDFL
jgi:hypothetical protein